MEFEVQVRAGGEARIADEADPLALMHPDARPDAARDAQQMGVTGSQHAGMRDLHSVAVAPYNEAAAAQA